MHANTRGATEPISCTFTAVWEVLWCFREGFLGATHPPELGSALQQREACGGLHDSPAMWQSARLSLCTDRSHVPADEQKAAPSLCPALPSALQREGHGFPASSPPQPAYFGCACPILHGSLALLPRSPCWDLAAALTSLARAEGTHWAAHKKSFLLPAGRLRGVPWAGLTVPLLLWALLAMTCPYFFERAFLYMHLVRAGCDAGPVAPSACRQCQQDSCAPGFPLLHARLAARVPRG